MSRPLSPPAILRQGTVHRFPDGTTFPQVPPVATARWPIMGTTEWSALYDGNAIEADLLALNPNAHLQCIRTYEGGLPATYTSPLIGTGVMTWPSFSDLSIPAVNSGAMDAALEAHFASIPANHRMLWTPLHETDNDKLGTSTPAEFRAFVKRITERKNASAQNPDNVSISVILTAEPYRNGTYLQYFPEGGEFDVPAADPYRFARDINDPSYLPDPKAKGPGTPRTMAYLIGDLPDWADSIGKPFALGEYGAHSWSTKPLEKARWLEETDAFLSSRNCYVAIYFHSPKGKSGPWLADRQHVYTADETNPARLTGGSDIPSLTKLADIVARHHDPSIQ